MTSRYPTSTWPHLYGVSVDALVNLAYCESRLVMEGFNMIGLAVAGIWIGLAGLVVWGNWRFWDRLKKTPHNNIKGLDTK